MSTSTNEQQQPEDTTVVDQAADNTPPEADQDETAEVDEAAVTTETGPAGTVQEEVHEPETQKDREGEDQRSDRRSASTPAQDLVREGEIAADFLETLLDIADLDGDLEVDVEGDRAAVAIVDSEDGAAPRRLVGPAGEVLEALQELTRLAVQAETGDRSRLMLDVAGFRADRRTDLVRTAKRAIDEVKESGERRELPPMTAFERKVVHDEVLAAGLHSESEGAEPSRFVVVLPAG